MAAASSEGPWLVFGGTTGWIGRQMMDVITARGRVAVAARSRLEDPAGCAKELDEVKPSRVVNCAGLTGRPNVDWCEDHKFEVMRVNVIGTLSLMDLCHARNIHMTNFATGCIFKYDEAHPIGGPGFTEEDEPNFFGSYYSMTKGHVETLSKVYPNVLTLRVRMPIADDLSPRSFITKIVRYEKVVNIPNSMTVLTDMLPVAFLLTDREKTGVFNFTNPGAISHNQILQMYKDYIDPSYTWVNFTEEEQNKILKAARSNNTLDTTKLEAALPDVRILPIVESMHLVFQRMRDILKREGNYPPPNPKLKAAPVAATPGCC